jgi:hypothetical protein
MQRRIIPTCTGTQQYASYCTMFPAVHTTTILSKYYVTLCKIRATCTVPFRNCSIFLCIGQKRIEQVKQNIQNSIPSVPLMGAQLLCVHSSLLVWKEGVSKQIFIEFCIFYIIRLCMVAHCIRSYCNFTVECTFTFTLNNATCSSLNMVLMCTPWWRLCVPAETRSNKLYNDMYQCKKL